MKTLGILLLVAGVVALAMPVVSFLLADKPAQSRASDPKRVEPVSFAPLLGVTFLSVGGAILVAGAITGRK
jgi:uncharacterized membrane protein HdeD (DUF308 family)